MSWDLFWHGDPWAVRLYREADRLSMRRADQLAWLQGRYVYDAMGSMAPLYNAFSNRGASKYDEVPYAEREEWEAGRAEREAWQNGEAAARDIARRIDAYLARAERDEGEVGDVG